MQQALGADTVVGIPAARRARPTHLPWKAWGMLVGLGALCLALWWVATSGAYTSGDEIGYNLGLAGGILMLLLLLYPLRKRVRALEALGPVRHWFSMHMALGIAGPTLVLLHSRFQLGSLNASIAFWSMVLVAASGVVGRFLYRQLHHGLFGRQASLQQIRLAAGIGESQARTWIRYVPQIQEQLDAFAARAEIIGHDGLRHPLRFLTLGLRAHLTARRALALLERELPIVAQARGWDEATLERRLGKGRRLVRAYIAQLQAIAQFEGYERLFGLWHVLHLPFVFMLFFSAVAHVLYVHMY